MPGKLADQVAIVTGGNSGIGEGTVHLFAQEGAKVAIVARREAEGRAVEQAVKDKGGEALFISCDVSDREQVDSTVQTVFDTYGRIDILFNNAGGGDRGNFPDESDDGWNRVLAVNLTGTFFMSRAVWPHMIDGGGGKVVNMSSVAAQRGFSKKMYDLVGRGPSASYYAAKAGVDAFTRYAAGMGGQHNIRVNCVRPGQIITPLTDTGGGNHSLKAMFDFIQILDGKGYPEDVANAVLFLVSDDAKFITGEFINIDGGMPGKL
jgi:NAD(P)-dependent dehydrogenase (short-subunit alcohol dehydrogenase family)